MLHWAHHLPYRTFNSSGAGQEPEKSLKTLTISTMVSLHCCTQINATAAVKSNRSGSDLMRISFNSFKDCLSPHDEPRQQNVPIQTQSDVFMHLINTQYLLNKTVTANSNILPWTFKAYLHKSLKSISVRLVKNRFRIPVSISKSPLEVFWGPLAVTIPLVANHCFKTHQLL